MKNKAVFITVYILALIVTLVNTFYSIRNYLFADMNELPVGEFVSEHASVEGDRTVEIYLVKNSLGTAVRGELVFSSGDRKNIFWQTGISGVNVRWGPDNVSFFNNVPLSGNGDNSYDCRRGTSLFTDGALENDRLKY